jgi:outer membrane protein TolC
MKKKLALSILLLYSFANSYAQITIPASLQDAVQKAIEKNSAIKNKELEIEKIQIQEKSVRNKYIPTIEANALYSYFDNKLTVDFPATTLPVINSPLFEGKSTFDNYGNIFNASLMAKMILFSGMQIPNGANALKQKAIGTGYLKESEKDNITKEVLNSFDQLLLIKEMEILINESDKRLQTETKRVSKAIEQGLAIPYERDKIKLSALELDSKRIELEGKRKLLYKKISYLTGYSVTEINAIQYNLVPYLLSEEKLTTENKQEIKALESFKLANEYLLKKEKGSFLPTLGAFGGVTHASLFNANATTPVITGIDAALYLGLNEMTISPNWMFGAAMKWEVFSGFERQHKIHEAKINIEQVQNQIDDTKQKLQLLLENNLVNYSVLNQKTEIAAQQEKVANNNLNLAIKQYKEGLINISERLVAENDSFKASLNKITIIIDQRLAAIETVIATGELTKYISNQK